MSRRVLIIVLAGLLAVSSVGSAIIVYGQESEQVVEGHTVFATIMQPPVVLNNSTKATAVAVLVREVTRTFQNDRFPGLLWFNDQYLVDPFKSRTETNETRYPCWGSILAVNSGDPDPRLYQTSDYLDHYVESYHLTDPNNKQWDVHKWNLSGELVWTTSILHNNPLSNQPDDGHANCKPASDGVTATNHPTDYGTPGYAYPCGGVDGAPCSSKLQYNGVLFFYLDDLKVNGSEKDHTPGSYNYTHDVSGCDNNWNNEFKDNWPCPQGDDEREGNSHPYNPSPNATGNQERDSHGWSADCDGDGQFDRLCHGTRWVDLYYGTAPQPITPNWVLVDDEGNVAPYHCHEDPDPFLDTCV